MLDQFAAGQAHLLEVVSRNLHFKCSTTAPGSDIAEIQFFKTGNGPDTFAPEGGYLGGGKVAQFRFDQFHADLSHVGPGYNIGRTFWAAGEGLGTHGLHHIAERVAVAQFLEVPDDLKPGGLHLFDGVLGGAGGYSFLHVNLDRNIIRRYGGYAPDGGNMPTNDQSNRHCKQTNEKGQSEVAVV